MAAKNPAQVDRLVLCSMAAEPSGRAGAALRSWEKILHANGLEAMAWAALPTIFGEAYLAENRRILDKMVNAVATRNRADALLAHLDAMTRYPLPFTSQRDHSSAHSRHLRRARPAGFPDSTATSPRYAAAPTACCRKPATPSPSKHQTFSTRRWRPFSRPTCSLIFSTKMEA